MYMHTYGFEHIVSGRVLSGVFLCLEGVSNPFELWKICKVFFRSIQQFATFVAAHLRNSQHLRDPL